MFLSIVWRVINTVYLLIYLKLYIYIYIYIYIYMALVCSYDFHTCRLTDRVIVPDKQADRDKDRLGDTYGVIRI